MKLYSNPLATLLVSGCAVCPNKKIKRYKTATGFTSRYECQAITCERLDYSVPGNKLSYHPPVSDAIRQGGFLEDCPLPDALPFTPSISTPVGENGGSPA